MSSREKERGWMCTSSKHFCAPSEMYEWAWLAHNEIKRPCSSQIGPVFRLVTGPFFPSWPQQSHNNKTLPDFWEKFLNHCSKVLRLESWVENRDTGKRGSARSTQHLKSKTEYYKTRLPTNTKPLSIFKCKLLMNIIHNTALTAVSGDNLASTCLF